MASPASELGQTSQQIDDLQSQSQSLDASYQQALADLVSVDSEVSRYNNEIADVNQRRADLQASIQQQQQQLQGTQKQLDDRQATLQKRLLGSYKSDDVGYLDVVMGANNFSDLINRVDMINTIAESDRGLIDSIKEAKQSLEDNINSLAGKQKELDSLAGDLNSAQQSLVAAKTHQQSVVDSLKSQKLANDGQLANLQAQAASIESRMNQIQSSSSSGSSGGDGDYSPPPGGGATITVQATAYCLAGSTATGMPVGRGIIAVDPSVIPLGARVHVSGYGDAVAADTGGAIVGNRIDVWLPCGEAYAWGNRTVTVTIY